MLEKIQADIVCIYQIQYVYIRYSMFISDTVCIYQTKASVFMNHINFLLFVFTFNTKI